MSNLNKKPMTQSERSEKYKKSKNIKRLSIDLQPDEYELIINNAKNMNMCYKHLIIKSVEYVVKNGIKLD